MNNSTTLKELMDIIDTFCKERDWQQYHTPKDLAIGISTEANELLQIFRFKSDSDIKDLLNSARKSDVEEELADVLYFLLRFAQLNDIDLATAMKNKIKKNEEKYPAEKVKGNNKKYNEY